MSFAELREVRLGGGHFIPTLEDALEELGPTLLVNIELKAPRALRPRAVHPEHVLATDRRVAAWHARGLAVNVWTVDEEHELRRLRAVGVDGIITNDPARARRCLAGAEG